jgi:tRNA modification GTPase
MPADTIYALSSGSPPAGIAVVRISGPSADTALLALAGRLPEPRRASVAALRHPLRGELLDRALVLRFPGSGSATGEDVAELHLHGGRSVVGAVLGALAAVPGLRQAEPGEFTRRAFESGRIDLAEAEGLADLLAAETEAQRRAALQLAGGALSREVERWQAELLGLAAEIEAALDFADEGDVGADLPPEWRERLARLCRELQAALARAPAERLRDGIRVILAGPPNAGKSSLFNALVGREAAIISPLPGTTRDLIEAPVAIAGIPFLLVDTAGLRESGDAVEAIGVDRAKLSLAAADIILWLGDPEAPPDQDRTLVVGAKSDLGPPQRGIDLAVSALTGEGLERLVDCLRERAKSLLPGEGEMAINARHRAVLRDVLASLGEAGSSDDLLIAAESLRLARLALDRLTGRAGVEDMLDALFGRFCIGK